MHVCETTCMSVKICIAKRLDKTSILYRPFWIWLCYSWARQQVQESPNSWQYIVHTIWVSSNILPVWDDLKVSTRLSKTTNLVLLLITSPNEAVHKLVMPVSSMAVRRLSFARLVDDLSCAHGLQHGNPYNTDCNQPHDKQRLSKMPPTWPPIPLIPEPGRHVIVAATASSAFEPPRTLPSTSNPLT